MESTLMFAGVMHSHDLRHSVVSVSQLTIHGFRVTFSGDTAEVIHPDGQHIECVKQPGRAIWWVPLDQIFETPTPDLQDFIGALGEGQPDVDELELLHRRTGHTSHNTLREAVRNLLVTGVVLPRRHFGSKAKQKYKGLCDICGRSKIARRSFPRRPDRLANLRPGSRVSADVIIMLNTTSLEGYKYVLLLEDNASKYVWSFPLKDRTAPEILTQLKTFLTHDLPALGITLEHFHSDGGSELISELVRTFLHAKGITTSHTPRDTPEMNSLLERKVRDLKERVMSMLLHSTLPVSFWWMAWKTACYLQNRMPTVTVYGYMTPFENVRGAPPSLKRLRIWGCNAYVLKPKAARRKDFDDKAYSGFHAGYADDDRGYEIYIPELDKIVSYRIPLTNTIESCNGSMLSPQRDLPGTRPPISILWDLPTRSRGSTR
jgi:hypothetical protein